MTKLTPGKPLIRETAAFDYTDAIVVELHPKHVRLRLKGQHGGLEMDYTEILRYARKLRGPEHVKAAR